MSPASARGAASAHIEAQSSPSSPAPPVKRRKLNDKASSPTIASRVDVASSSALNGTATASPVATKALSDTGPSRLAAGALGEGDDSSASVAGTSREGSNVPAASDRELAKQQRGKDKKKRKELQRALSAPPSFAYNIQGFKNRTIGIKDVRDFVLHLFNEEKAQPWLYVKNRSSIQKVVAVMLPGLTTESFGVPPPPGRPTMPFEMRAADGRASELPIMQQLFSHACPTQAPGDKLKMHSCYQHFVSCPLTAGEKARRHEARKERGQRQKTNDAKVYLTGREDMLEHGYPMPERDQSVAVEGNAFESWIRADEWIETPVKLPSTDLMKVLAIDCEMCLTTEGHQLARVSVVNFEGQNIFDALVKPEKPIVDYLTQYSGMTAERLAGATHTFDDVQRRLTELIDFNTILVGHSLECDLRTLKLSHPWVIDTSVLYQHPRGPPFKASLKWLATKWLKKEIQSVPVAGGVSGHDSEQDARTCIELLRLKMEKGPGFGDFTTDQETIFERIGRGTNAKQSAVVDNGNSGQLHGNKASTLVTCQSDEEVLENVIASLDSHDLVFARFMELSHAREWSQPSTPAAIKTGAPEADAVAKGEPEHQAVAKAHAGLNDRLVKLREALPPLTALILFNGHDDPRPMSQLLAKKNKFDRLFKTVKLSEIADEDRWMAQDERDLGDAVERCRRGLSFYYIK